jgi:hypothetical protein
VPTMKLINPTEFFTVTAFTNPATGSSTFCMLSSRVRTRTPEYIVPTLSLASRFKVIQSYTYRHLSRKNYDIIRILNITAQSCAHSPCTSAGVCDTTCLQQIQRNYVRG